MAQADHLPSRFRDPGIRRTAIPSTSPIKAAYADFIARLTRCPPQAIPVDPYPYALEDRAEHVRGLFATISDYLEAVLVDTAQNIPGGIDRRQIDALLSDLMSEVSGTLQKAADDLAGRVQ
jgi:hypothetical protein